MNLREISFTGPSYREILLKIHRNKKIKPYISIKIRGCVIKLVIKNQNICPTFISKFLVKILYLCRILLPSAANFNTYSHQRHILILLWVWTQPPFKISYMTPLSRSARRIVRLGETLILTNYCTKQNHNQEETQLKFIYVFGTPNASWKKMKI